MPGHTATAAKESKPPGGTIRRDAPAMASLGQGARPQRGAELCLNRAFSHPRSVKGAGSGVAKREAHEHTQRGRKRYREQEPDKTKQVSKRKKGKHEPHR